jgi:hypothetical protein
MPSCTDNSSHISASHSAPFGSSPLFGSCEVWQLRSLAVAKSGSCAVWHFARFGISRGLAFRAVWHFARFGISRSLAFRAVWHFAQFGSMRRLAARARKRTLPERKEDLPPTRTNITVGGNDFSPEVLV